MPGKLTRKEIQQDQIRNVLEDVYEWLHKNTAYLGAAIGVFAVLVLGAYFWQSYQESATVQRQAQLAKALQILHAPLEGDEAAVEPGHEGHDHGTTEDSKYRFATAEERYQKALEAFSALAQSSPDSRTGQIARYYEAITLHELGRDDEAVATLRALIGDLDQPEVANLARNQLALILQAQGKTDEAIEEWEQILAAPDPNFPRDQLLATLGKACESAGREAAALDYYRQLVSEFPTAPQTRELERRIDYLEAYVEASPQPESGEETASS